MLILHTLVSVLYLVKPDLHSQGDKQVHKALLHHMLSHVDIRFQELQNIFHHETDILFTS